MLSKYHHLAVHVCMSLESNDPALHELPSGRFNVDGENMYPNKAQTVHRGS